MESLRGIATPPLRMSDFALNYINIEGSRFLLHGRPYLWPFYTLPMKRVMLKFGRQCEKSTGICMRMLYFSFGAPHFRSLYVTPSQEQTRQFSTDKVKRILLDSPILRKKFVSNRDKIDRVFQKMFSNGSTIHFRSAYLTADRTRGITADHLAIDEIQDVLSDHLPVIEETLSHSAYKYLIYAGTPKTFENTLQQQWERTTQNEFLIKCDSCRKYNFIDDGNIGLTGMICSNKLCGKPLYTHNGIWVATNPKADMHGFRVPQLIVPWVKDAEWNDIVRKYETYEKGKFYNEVLGLSHDLAEMATTRKQLIVCCEPHRSNVQRLEPRPGSKKPYFYPNIFIGVDWGLNLGSYTVVTVGAFLGKRFDILYIEKFEDTNDHMEQIDRIAEIAYRFNATALGCDFGAGFMESAELQKKIPNRSVIKIYSSANQKEKIAWNDKAKMFVVNRDRTLGDLFSLINRSTTNDRLITFPKYEHFEPFTKDFLVMFKDYNSKTRKVYYDKKDSESDDVAHSMNFCHIVAQTYNRYALKMGFQET